MAWMGGPTDGWWGGGIIGHTTDRTTRVGECSRGLGSRDALAMSGGMEQTVIEKVKGEEAGRATRDLRARRGRAGRERALSRGWWSR
jgi:hypothetical protein